MIEENKTKQIKLVIQTKQLDHKYLFLKKLLPQHSLHDRNIPAIQALFDSQAHIDVKTTVRGRAGKGANNVSMIDNTPLSLVVEFGQEAAVGSLVGKGADILNENLYVFPIYLAVAGKHGT